MCTTGCQLEIKIMAKGKLSSDALPTELVFLSASIPAKLANLRSLVSYVLLLKNDVMFDLLISVTFVLGQRQWGQADV